jgi:DNA-binding LacI/PurR family transcriptional regulator
MSLSPIPPEPSRQVTIQDIADTLGVHKSTVSNALSGKGRISKELRSRVMSLAGELGYEPDPLAQRLSNRAHSKVVCLCCGALGPGRGTEKIAYLQSSLTGQGLEVPIYTPAILAGHDGEAQAALFKQVRRVRPQAIVLCAYTLHEQAMPEIQAYQRDGGIVVSYDLPIPLECDQIIFDREDNAYQGARYLLERGHRNIGIGMSRLVQPIDDPHNMTQHLRLRGFKRAMEEFGTEMHGEWFFENRSFERGGAEMARHFLELKERPTALCIVNDYVALAFMVEIMKRGVKVPQELSVVGHDNQPIVAYCPVPLTSVSQPAGEIIQAVVQRVMARLDGDTGPVQTITIRGDIVERESVAVVEG